MRKVTILERLSDGADAMTFRVVFWVRTPSGRETYYANGAKTSVMSELQTMPTTQELADLRDGKVIEIVDNVNLDKKDAQGVLYTTQQFQAAAAAKLQAIHGQLVSQAAITNPHILFNTRWSDESGWVVQSLP